MARASSWGVAVERPFRMSFKCSPTISAPNSASLSCKLAAVSSAWMGIDCRTSIGPVSNPTSICMRVTPVSLSPAKRACWMGEAPRHRGSSEACTFKHPCAGKLSTCGRKIWPNAATTIMSGCHCLKGAAASSLRSDFGWYIGMPACSATTFTGEGRNCRPRPAGRSGWVTTPTTVCVSISFCKLGTEKSGVPMNTTVAIRSF